MGAIERLKRRSFSLAEIIAESLGLIAAASGATFAAVMGKAFVAVVLAGVATGLVLRLTGRRRAEAERVATVVPVWSRPVAALLSATEVAALVEAVDLPVRLSQPGFEYSHWLLVGIAFVALYFLQLGLLKRFGRRGEAKGAAKPLVRGEAQRQAARPAGRGGLSYGRRAWRLAVGPASTRTLGRANPESSR